MSSIRQTPAFLAQLMDASNDGIFAFDRSYQILYWNKKLAAQVGVAREKALGCSVFELFPSLAATGEQLFLQDALSGRSGTTGVTHLETGAPQERPLFSYTRYEPLRDDDGAVIGGIGVVHDITQYIEMEAQTQESETRFRTMADNSPVLLWMSGTDARCVFFNQRWLDFTGRTLAQESGYGWAEGVHPEDFQDCVDTYMESFRLRREFSMEYRLRRRDGVYRWMIDNGLPRLSPGGTFAGYIGSCIDITERKAAEAERERLLRREQANLVEAQRLQRQAEEASRLRDEFLATVSHELRTPLNAIAGWAELLSRGLVEPGDTPEAIASIERNARIQTRLINDLLDVSRIVAGTLHLAVQPVELTTVARTAVDAVRLSADAKRLKFAVETDPSLGPVEGDATRLQQVVWNLLTNAVKFTPTGGDVRLTLRRSGSRAEIIVRDTGEGIEASFLPYVFDRFRQADSSLTRRHGGLGIGLSIVRHLVEMHGGTVFAASDGPGKGSIFTVDLPLMAVRLPGPVDEVSPEDSTTSAPGLV